MWVYYENNTIVGAISTRDITHISLLFVDKNHHRRGIAREMLNVVLDDLKKREDVPCITVNSSPYAG
jgi:Acetyltransferase (GNAT) family.